MWRLPSVTVANLPWVSVTPIGKSMAAVFCPPGHVFVASYCD